MISKRTTLAEIKSAMMSDFEVELTDAQAKEVKDACVTGCATWTPSGYKSTRSGDSVRRVTHRKIA